MTQIATMALPGRFDYSYHQKFAENLELVINDSKVKEIVLDFNLVDYLDSSALGMIVMLQKKAAAANKAVYIKGARGTTIEILLMANMQKLFKFI